MAYANWVTPNKTQGSGNDTVSWTGQTHTGHSSRQTTATFKATDCNDVILTINQAGKTEFVDISDTSAVPKTGGSITVTGTANSSKLTFSLTNNNIGLTLPSSYVAASVTTNNGASITGDPGATQEYTFSITFSNIGANASSTAKTSQLVVTANNGTTDTCTITQAAASPYLTVEPTTINLTAAGTAVSVSVSSNTDWSIV